MAVVTILKVGMFYRYFDSREQRVFVEFGLVEQVAMLTPPSWVQIVLVCCDAYVFDWLSWCGLVSC